MLGEDIADSATKLVFFEFSLDFKKIANYWWINWYKI